jgi:hypothetical protein
MDRTSRILAKQLDLMNRHLAKKKIDLKSLLKEEKPKIVLRDETAHSIDIKELEKLAELIPKEYHSKLFLPIYIELSSGKYGRGTARISGKIECMVVAKILGRESYREDETFIYRPDLRKLRRELPTTTQYMFSL